MLDPKYSIDLPVSYVRAAILLDSITDYANAPTRRKTGYLYQYSCSNGYQPSSIVARYTNVQELGDNYIPSTAGIDHLLDKGLLPEEIVRTGRDFLAAVQFMSHRDACWLHTQPVKKSTGPAKTRPALTLTGKRHLRDIMDRFGLNGISQTIGLTELLA